MGANIHVNVTKICTTHPNIAADEAHHSMETALLHSSSLPHQDSIHPTILQKNCSGTIQRPAFKIPWILTEHEKKAVEQASTREAVP